MCLPGPSKIAALHLRIQGMPEKVWRQQNISNYLNTLNGSCLGVRPKAREAGRLLKNINVRKVVRALPSKAYATSNARFGASVSIERQQPRHPAHRETEPRDGSSLHSD